MMQEVEVYEIEGKEFYVVATIDKYHYLAEITNPNNIIVLKNYGEELKSLTDEELDKALILYYQNTNK